MKQRGKENTGKGEVVNSGKGKPPWEKRGEVNITSPRAKLGERIDLDRGREKKK